MSRSRAETRAIIKRTKELRSLLQERQIDTLRSEVHGELLKRANAEAREAKLREALSELLDAWDCAEGGRGCYSCSPQHDCRCELDRKISDRCTCGRVELEAAAKDASAVLGGGHYRAALNGLPEMVQENEREQTKERQEIHFAPQCPTCRAKGPMYGCLDCPAEKEADRG